MCYIALNVDLAKEIAVWYLSKCRRICGKMRTCLISHATPASKRLESSQILMPLIALEGGGCLFFLNFVYLIFFINLDEGKILLEIMDC